MQQISRVELGGSEQASSFGGSQVGLPGGAGGGGSPSVPPPPPPPANLTDGNGIYQSVRGQTMRSFGGGGGAHHLPAAQHLTNLYSSSTGLATSETRMANVRPIISAQALPIRTGEVEWCPFLDSNA